MSAAPEHDARSMLTRITWAVVTARGRVRKINQDAFVVGGLIGVGDAVRHQGVSAIPDAGVRVFAVVDGMGGHAGGEDAAILVAAELARLDGALLPERFDSWMESVSDKVLRAGIGLETPTMGAALAMLVVTSLHIVSVNIGDCRAYKLEDGYLGQLSVDDREPDGPANILTQSLGGEPRALDAHALRERLPVEAGARYLLCSDGIYGFVAPAELKAALVRAGTPSEAVEDVAMLADEVSQDNYTALVFDIAY